MARTARWKKEDVPHGIIRVTLASWKYFHDYLEEIIIDKKNYIFRGQEDELWKLEPTLIRHCKSNPESKFDTVMNEHLSNFKFAIRGRTNNLKDIINDDDELWALGQHNGLNTPLLDFTFSPYVAAYFAFCKPNVNSSYRVIYGISQAAVEMQLKEDLSLYKPISDYNVRLLSQGGMFVKFKNENDVEAILQKYYNADEKKIKLFIIKIPSKNREMCLKFLNSMNINHNTLFPDLYGSSIYCNTKLSIKNY